MFLVAKRFKKFKYFSIFFIILIFLIFLLSQDYFSSKSQPRYGITFSQKQAKDLGLDWQRAYLTILDELHIKNLRLSAYWNEIEKDEGLYRWQNTDWMISEASKRNIAITLAVGGRLPRWPECHFPDWAKELNDEARQEKILNYINKTVNRYKNIQSIKTWQVENEPFLSNFGDCPKPDASFLDKEIALVKMLDTRPITITDSGELSLWIPAAKRADIFGTTMYRDTYSEHLKMYIHYPMEPGFFKLKKNITSWFAKPDKWIVIELQAEPWGRIPFQYLPKDEKDKTMNPAKFREMIIFANETGFDEFYLWGAEWWLWEKETQQNDEMWNEAKKLFIYEKSK